MSERDVTAQSGEPHPCPACGGGDLCTPHGASVTGEPLAICRACRHVFFPAPPTESEIADYYARTYTDEHALLETQTANHAYYIHHAADLLRHCRRRLLPPSIVDVGSSFPVFAEAAREAGFARALSVDPSDSVRAWGLERGLEVAAPESLTSVARGLGAARYSHCLEHLVDPGAELRRIRTVLAPGGLLYVTQPLFPICRPDAAAPRYKDSVFPEHLHFFNVLSLSRLIERAGFHLLRIDVNTRVEETRELFLSALDAPFAKRELARLARIGPRGGPGAHPGWLGENVAVWARRALRRPRAQDLGRSQDPAIGRSG